MAWSSFLWQKVQVNAVILFGSYKMWETLWLAGVEYLYHKTDLEYILLCIKM